MKMQHPKLVSFSLAVFLLISLAINYLGARAQTPTGNLIYFPIIFKWDSNLDISVCAPDAGPFSTEINHPYLPYPKGRVWVLKGVEDEEELRVRITVLDNTEVVAGITTRVVEEREWEDNELIEVSRNFFVQAPDGTVCYYGEDVDIYEDGQVVSHDGAWRAGVGGNLPGIVMPAKPMAGHIYAQEVAPGIAEDQAKIVAIGETVTVPAGTFTNTLRTRETTPLEPGSVSIKRYAPGVGLIVDDVVKLISVTN